MNLPTLSAVFLLSLPMLLIGCQPTQNIAEQPTSKIRLVVEESNEIIELQELAKQGDVEAQILLAKAYDEGKGVYQDSQKAFQWYQKAANQGHSFAQYGLAWQYYIGNGVEQNYSKAFEWYEKAANQGHIGGQYNLGSTPF